MDPEISNTPMQVTWGGTEPDDQSWVEFRGRILDEWDAVDPESLDDARGDWDAIVAVIRKATGDAPDAIASKMERWASIPGPGPADEPPSPRRITPPGSDPSRGSYPPHDRPAPPPPGG